MNYKAEDNEDKKYKKGYGRKEFKKDVAEAVKPQMEKVKKKMKNFTADSAPAGPKSKKGGRSTYAKMKVAELRKFLNEKKKALLVKSGFPDGAIPRSKEAMISLCLKLKRKRW